MNNYELERHKSGDRIKWVLTLLAFIVIAVMLVGIIFGWFTKPSTNEPSETPTQDSQPATDENGQELVANVVHDMPRAMTYRSARMLKAASANSEDENDSVTIRATVMPYSMHTQLVNWSIKFANPNSTWANGKMVTDYVTVTPAGTDSPIATVTCLRPFSEPISVIATSKLNPEISATCDIGFEVRVLGVRATLEAEMMDGTHRELVIGETPTYTFDGVSSFIVKSMGLILSEHTTGSVATNNNYNFHLSGTDELMAQMRSLTYDDFGITQDEWGGAYYLDVFQEQIIIKEERDVPIVADFSDVHNICYLDWVSTNTSIWGKNGYDQSHVIPQPYLTKCTNDVFYTACKKDLSTVVWRITLTATSISESYTTVIECFGTANQFPIPTPNYMHIDWASYNF